MRKLITLIYLTLMVTICSAQQDLTMYNMNSVGESIEVNPSLMPENKGFIGLPGISYNYFLFSNNSFTYRDIHTVRSDDSTEINVDNAISKLNNKNFFTTQARINLLGFGFHIKKNYFSGNISERANFSFVFPKELLQLISQGNGPFIGQTLDFSNMGFDGTHFREYTFGWAREVSTKLTLGVRLKYLYGMENYSSSIEDLSLTTDPNDYGITTNTKITINSSTPSNNAESYDQFNGLGWGAYVSKLNNKGYGGDFGATYKLNEKWSFNTSVLDLGYINWKNDVKNYVTDAGTYRFDGVDISEFVSDSSGSGSSTLDTLSSTFKTEETSNSYTTYLPTHVYLTSSFKINDKSSASALLHATFFKNTIQPTYTLGYNVKVGRHLRLAANYSYINQNFNNIGLGMTVNAGPFQYFATTDNIIGALDPLSNNTAHVHFGFNLIFGRPAKGNVKVQVNTPAKVERLPDADKDGIPDNLDRCPNNFGLAIFKGCPDTDGDSIPDVDDNCATEKGSKALKGCPDSDGDLVINKLDSCPNVKGPASNNGCPVKEKAIILASPVIHKITKEETAVISKVFNNLEFEEGKSTILQTSNSALDELVNLLKKKPSYILFIDGHTDNVGSAESNLKLSKDRAESVKKYIVDKGVEGSRITAMGFGMTRPVLPNTTAEGRKKNRRVELQIQ